jgi:hypothetical protein
MATSRWKAAKDLINDASVEVGLSAVVDPFASTDQNFILICRLLNSTGRKLAQRPKLALVKEATMTVAALDTGLYSLPDDFVSFVDQSAFDRTGMRPIALPTSSQEWQRLRAWNTASTLWIRARVVGGQFEVFELPAVGTVIAVEYVSRAWVLPATSSEPDADACTATTDVVMFEPDLVVSALKLRWKQSKGKDSTAELAEFEMALDAAESVGPSPVLDLAGSHAGERFLDETNIPDTGFGM